MNAVKMIERRALKSPKLVTPTRRWMLEGLQDVASFTDTQMP
jgi:hypothetical protein